EQLTRALDQAKVGHGQIVGVMGEPGLGKSRLFYVFKLTSHSGCLVLEAYSVSYGKASPYLPLIELLKSYLQLQPQDDARTRRQKVIGKVLELDRSLEDTLPYLYALLGVEEQPSPLQQMDPQIRRQRTFAALKQIILEKTEGTPFFMEEVVQTLAEEGVLSGERSNYRLEKAPTELHISPTVQGVLAARIDRLTAEEKDLLHQLAVMGRQFPLSLVRQVVAQPEEALYRLLASLQRKEFLYEQPAFPEVEYTFKHALTQEVAYTSLLQERRKSLHERTAQAIEMLFHSKLDDHYSELAHHYSRSGNTEKAIKYLQRAGQQAAQRSAN